MIMNLIGALGFLAEIALYLFNFYISSNCKRYIVVSKTANEYGFTYIENVLGICKVNRHSSKQLIQVVGPTQQYVGRQKLTVQGMT